jgi:hypothetical protein
MILLKYLLDYGRITNEENSVRGGIDDYGRFEPMPELYLFHPAAVHFPIAFLAARTSP